MGAGHGNRIEEEGAALTLSHYGLKRARVLPDKRTGGTLTHRRPGWVELILDAPD